MRDILVPRTDAEYRLYPYAKNLRYGADGMVSMTIEIFNDTRTEEFSFAFMCSPQLRRFLDRTIGDEAE
jgi:hypothetical protein